MMIADLMKSSLGLVEGIGKSKKLGLATAFVAICLGIVSSAPTPIDRVAALAAATITVAIYVVAQSRVEAKGAELVQIDEAGAEK